MAFSGLSGQYGSIPQSIIKQKYEVTRIFEDPNDLESYQRSVLVDQGPDPIFYESDQKRTDTHSNEFLSMRHTGHRTGEVPDHSEAFLELTEKDPRGVKLDPNLNQFVEQSRSRAGYFRFLNDDDHTVTETELPDKKRIENRIGIFDLIKQRLKIFNTSRDNYMSGKNFKNSFTPGTGSEYQKSMVGFNDEFAASNKTTLLSNSTALGWERTTDHMFMVASYADSANTERKTYADPSGGRNETITDSQMTIFKDQYVSVGLAQVMKSIAMEQSARLQAGDMSYHLEHFLLPTVQRIWQPTQMLQNREVNADQRNMIPYMDLTPKVAGTLGNPMNASWSTNLDSQMKAGFMQMVARTANKNQQCTMLETMQSDKVKKSWLQDYQLRKQIAATNKLGRDWQESAKWKESMQIAQIGYKRANSKGDQMRKNFVGESYTQQSTERATQAYKNPYTKKDNHVQSEQYIGEFGVRDRLVGGIGNKFTRDLIQSESNSLDVNDM